jgi:hypothetical protein
MGALMAATAILPHNILRLSGVGTDAETITLNGVVYELDTHATATITAGRTRVNVSGGSTRTAAQVLTLSTAVPSADETFTVGGKAYTWKETVGSTANEVLIGADIEACIDNAVAAINAGTGAGTVYGSATTANANVTAAKTTAATLTATAKVPGVGGNSIASTETMANGAWGAATLAGGASPTAAEIATAVAAVMIQDGIQAIDLGSAVLVIDHTNRAPLACTETLANGAWDRATTAGGAPATDPVNVAQMHAKAATAADVTAGAVYFPLTFTPVAMMAQVRSAAGVAKAWDGAVTKLTAAPFVIAVDNSGSTDFADTDVITVLATA